MSADTDFRFFDTIPMVEILLKAAGIFLLFIGALVFAPFFGGRGRVQ
jgi:hypothetical protein